jgi:hypothetical protein
MCCVSLLESIQPAAAAAAQCARHLGCTPTSQVHLHCLAPIVASLLLCSHKFYCSPDPRIPLFVVSQNIAAEVSAARLWACLASGPSLLYLTLSGNFSSDVFLPCNLKFTTCKFPGHGGGCIHKSTFTCTLLQFLCLPTALQMLSFIHYFPSI